MIPVFSCGAYHGSIAAYDRKMPGSKIRYRKIQAFQLGKTHQGHSERMKLKNISARKAGKR